MLPRAIANIIFCVAIYAEIMKYKNKILVLRNKIHQTIVYALKSILLASKTAETYKEMDCLIDQFFIMAAAIGKTNMGSYNHVSTHCIRIMLFRE